MLRPLPPSPDPQADGDGTFERHQDPHFGVIEPVFFMFDLMRLAWEDRPFPLSPNYPTETPATALLYPVVTEPMQLFGFNCAGDVVPWPRLKEEAR